MAIRTESYCVDGEAPQAAAALVRGVRERFDADPKLLFVFASTGQPLEALVADVRASLAGTLVLSASSAGEFTERGDRKGAVSALAIDGDFHCSGGIAAGLAGDVEGAIDRALHGQRRVIDGYPELCAVLLLDPLAGHAEEAALLLAVKLGERARIAGGAAGDDLAMKRTFVGCNEQVLSDAAVVALLHTRAPLGIGVEHGHSAFSEAFTVTAANGSLVEQIEGRAAWPFWRDAIRERAAREGFDVDAIAPEDAVQLLLRFEGGLDAGSALKVRAPLAIEGDAIRFACEIPVGARLRITQSTRDGQVASAVAAARSARAQLGAQPVAGAVVFDCICRKIILGDRFDDAVRAISTALDGAPIAGFETYGEVALCEGDLSGFHNTTSVVLAIGARDG